MSNTGISPGQPPSNQPPSHQPAGNQPGETGRRPGSKARRVVAIVFVTVVALVASWLIIDSQRGSIQAALHSWEDPVGDVMPVTLEVDRAPDITLTCELVAVDDRAIVVGQLTLEIPAGGENRQRIDAEIPLRGDGIAPKLRGCNTSG